MKPIINDHHIINEDFLQDQNKLLNYYTNTYLWPKTTHKYGYHITREAIELVIRPQCNQKCEYCYITQHGDELYPQKINKKETLHNIKLFLDYFYVTKKNYTRQIELFAGDLFYDDIFFDILDIFDNYFKIIQKEQPDIFELPTVISIPSNLSFVYENPEKAKKVLKYVKYFKEQYFTRILFSWSTDGLYCVETREGKPLTQEYFDTIFIFCKEAGVGMHPMVSSSNVKYWKQNYQWWLDMYEKFDLSSGPGDFQPMMLEVRNNDWTDESISDFKDFLRFLMQKRLEIYDNDISVLTRHLLGNSEEENGIPHTMNYDPLTLYFNSNNVLNESVRCALQKTTTINCTNLSLALCHRLTYNLFTGGYFITDEENEHIIGLKAHNVPAYLAIKNTKNSQLPICYSCLYKDLCLKGCFGAQYEASGEILLPAENACKMAKAKIKFLVNLYNEYGIIDCARKQNLLNDRENIIINRILDTTEKEEAERWN